jgi:hypothetical protein
MIRNGDLMDTRAVGLANGLKIAGGLDGVYRSEMNASRGHFEWYEAHLVEPAPKGIIVAGRDIDDVISGWRGEHRRHGKHFDGNR